MMPGATGASARIPGPIDVPRVALTPRVASVERRVGGVMRDGTALAQGQAATARAELTRGDAMSRAVTEVGSAIGGIAQKVIMARESAELMEADARMKRASSDFLEGLPEDPYDWESTWEKASQVVRQEVVEKSKLSKAGREKLEKNFKFWDAEVATRLSSMTISRHAQIAKAKLNFAAKEALARHDLNSYAEIISGGVAAGIVGQSEGEIALQKGQVQVNREVLDLLIENDPVMAKQVVDGKPEWLTPMDAMKASRSIDQSLHNKRIEQFGVIENAIVADPNMSESKFQQLLSDQGPLLEPVATAKLTEYWTNGLRPDFEAMAKVRQDVLKLTDQSKVEEIWAMQERIGTEVHKDYRGQFLHLLSNSVNDRTGDENSFQARMFRQGSRLINASVDNAILPRPPGSLDSVNLQKEKVKVVLENELSLFLESNPGATDADMMKFLDSMNIEVRGSGVSNIAAPGLYVPREKTDEEIINSMGLQPSALGILGNLRNWQGFSANE